MQPIANLGHLDLGGVLHVEDDGVDAVGVADEVVVDHVVRLNPGELPNT